MRDSTFRSLTLHLDAARKALAEAMRINESPETDWKLAEVKGSLDLLDTLLHPLPVPSARDDSLASPGTIISGTLKPFDIIKACMKFLGNEQRLTFDESQALFLAWGRCGLDREKLNEFLLDTMWPVMERFAPEGHYFGAREGDGSDFGFWPIPNGVSDEDAPTYGKTFIP